MSLLPEPYYSACNEVFRRSTNQTEVMLREMEQLCRDRRRLSFQIPSPHSLPFINSLPDFSQPVFNRKGQIARKRASYDECKSL